MGLGSPRPPQHVRPCSPETLIRCSDPQVFIGGGLTAYHAPKFLTPRKKAGAQDKPQRLPMPGISSTSPQGTLGLFPKSKFQPKASLSRRTLYGQHLRPTVFTLLHTEGVREAAAPGNGLFIISPSLGEATVSCAQNRLA